VTGLTVSILGGKKMWAAYVYNSQKTAQSKQSPIGRKFAKSGHPEV
jgi:hypothetical protein